MGTMIQSYYLTEEQFRGLSPPLNFSLMFWFCLCSRLHIFFVWSSPDTGEEFKDHPKSLSRQQWSTLSHSTSCHLWAYTRYVLKMGTCSAHALLLIDAYIVTIWPHSLLVNVLFSLYISSHCLLLSRNTMKQELILQKPTPSIEPVYPRVIMGQSIWWGHDDPLLPHSLSLKCNLNFSLSCD